MGESNSDPPDCKPGTLSTRLFARIQCRDATLDACITFLKDLDLYVSFFNQQNRQGSLEAECA